MTADEPVAGVPRLCARRADCTRPRGHDDECGPDRADTELADLRAEVERLREEAREMQSAVTELAPRDEVLVCGTYFPRADLPRVLRNYMRAGGEAWSEAKSEHIKREKAEAERDALQRQVGYVTASLRVIVNALGPDRICDCTDSDDCGLRDEAADALSIARAALDALESADARTILAALDAVEPADQPHPTPEADEACDVVPGKAHSLWCVTHDREPLDVWGCADEAGS